MRFRLGRADDIHACVALLREDAALPLDGRLADALPNVLLALHGAGCLAAFSVFEEETASAFVTCAFGMTAFVDASLHRELRTRAEPYITPWLFEQTRQGNQPFLNANAIRDANSSGGCTWWS